MDFSFSEEQQAVQELARQILGDRMTEEHVRALAARGEGFESELWQTLAEASLLGVCLPEEQDGMGLGVLALALLCQEQGRTLAPVPLANAIALAALPIAEFGNNEQKARLLPGFVAGEFLLAGAFEELTVGSAAHPSVRATPDGGAWRLDGTKLCVPIADQARRIVVPATTGDGKVGVFLVDPSATGVKLEREQTTHGEAQFQVEFSGAAVAAEDVLGAPDEGAEIVRFATQRANVALSGLLLGISEEALRITAEYTGSRKQFGRPIGSFQGVQLRAADGFIDLEAMRSTLWQAGWALDAGRAAANEVSVAKWWAATGGQRIVHTAMHLHGGTGADVDYPIHRFFMWAKATELSLGGAREHQAALGAQLVAGG